jgi:hypothetical protein
MTAATDPRADQPEPGKRTFACAGSVSAQRAKAANTRLQERKTAAPLHRKIACERTRAMPRVSFGVRSDVFVVGNRHRQSSLRRRLLSNALTNAVSLGFSLRGMGADPEILYATADTPMNDRLSGSHPIRREDENSRRYWPRNNISNRSFSTSCPAKFDYTMAEKHFGCELRCASRA